MAFETFIDGEIRLDIFIMENVVNVEIKANKNRC